MTTSHRSFGQTILANVVSFALFLVIMYGLMWGARFLGKWPAIDSAQLFACAIGVFITVRFRAIFAALLVVGLLAFTATELAIHSVYGIDSVQGGPTHLAVIAASIIAALLAGVLVSRFAQPVRTAV